MGIAQNLPILILVGVITIIACQSSKNMAKQSQSIEFANIAEARSFNVPESGTSVIKSQQEWKEWWEKYWNRFSGTGEKALPPDVDFKNRMVVGVYWGEGHSGCSNGVNVIRGIERIEDSLIVTVGELPDLGPCDMVVYPIQMVEIPAMDLPIRFLGAVPGKD